MKSNGTAIATLLFGVLAAFFAYQWWFNPTREVQRRLNDIAAALSVPDAEPPVVRVTRAAQLRKFLAPDVRVTTGGGEVASRDAIVGAVTAFAAPPGGWNIQFVDVQISVDRETRTAAGVYMTVEVNGRDARTGQPTVDTREATATMRKENGEWVVASAEIKDALQR